MGFGGRRAVKHKRARFDVNRSHISSYGTHCMKWNEVVDSVNFRNAFVDMAMALGDCRVTATVRLFLWNIGIYEMGQVSDYKRRGNRLC